VAFRVKVLKLDKNCGFAGGVNKGYAARSSDSKYVVLLNNDAVPYLDNLIRIIEALEMDEDRYYMLLANGDLTVHPSKSSVSQFQRRQVF